MAAAPGKIWVVLNILLATVIFAVITIVVSLFDWRKRHLGIYTGLWARWILWSMRLRSSVQGLENLETGRRYVFVSNHASMIDIILALGYLPGTVAFMAKKSLFNIPLFGWAIRAVGCIPVDRSSRIKAQQSVDQGVRRLQRTFVNMILYPEGTRSRDGHLQPFKSGGFLLAIRSGIPIVPVATKGTFEALRSGGLNLTAVPLSLTIGLPIRTAELSDDDRHELRDQAYRAVSDLLSAA